MMIARQAAAFVILISLCIAFPTSREARSSGDGEIVKSASDDNEYRAVTLSNGIRCVVVSDRSTELAAVEIRVAAGYLADQGTPGLAHFVEHMVFEGSPEHPDGNLYQKYVTERGGYFNGATWESATTYLFTIKNDSWVKAARILASFIGNPHFPQEKFASAIEAVDSEYKIGIRNDYRSLYALAMSLSNPENQYGPFSTGNKETLNVTDIHEQSVEFHDQFYSGNLMTVAIVANDTIDRLETLAEEIFSKIPNRNRKKPKNSALPFPTNDKRYLGKKVYFKMKRNINELSLLFPINMENFVNIEYIKYLMDHEGRGSIYQYLLSRGYATSFGSFLVLDDSQTLPLVLYCQLTEKGIADPFFVVETVFEYLKAVRINGVDTKLWESIKQLNELYFRFQDKQIAGSLVSDILDKMGKSEDTRKYLGAPSQLTLDTKVENEILSFLHPDNFNLYIGSSSFSDSEATSNGPQLTKREYYYNTPYFVANFSEEQLEVWRNVETVAELHLPQPNNFIPTNFEVFDIEVDAEELPKEIQSRDEGDISIWWHQDQEWRQPRLSTGCMIFPRQVSRSSRAWALQSMAHEIYKLAKDLALYEAWEADFNADVTFGHSWDIIVYGFSDPKTVEGVLSRMLDILLNLDFAVDEALFYSTVVQPVVDYYDEDHQNSYYFAYNHIYSITYKDHCESSEAKKIARNITQAEVKEYMNNFLGDISLTCSSFGNVKQEHAMRYSNIIKEQLLEQGSSILNEDLRRLQDEDIFKIPPGSKHVIRRHSGNPDDETSATVVVFQVGREESNGGIDGRLPYTVFAFTGLLELIMGQSCFSYLRSEKQLGYMATCYSETYGHGVNNFVFAVQGSRPGAGPEVFDQEINNLINHHHDMFRNFAHHPDGVQKFEDVKEALKDKISIKPRTLMEKSANYMQQIYSSTGDFEKVKKQLEAIKAMSLESFLECYEKFIIGNEKRKISSQVYGTNHAIPDTIKEGEVLIDDVEAFRERLSEIY